MEQVLLLPQQALPVSVCVTFAVTSIPLPPAPTFLWVQAKASCAHPAQIPATQRSLLLPQPLPSPAALPASLNWGHRWLTVAGVPRG